ncbi:MAG: amidohydrolase family protein [Chloroflexi bacterium]|nr:amidohydrolase family protein [Chloroflexota bacterium]
MVAMTSPKMPITTVRAMNRISRNSSRVRGLIIRAATSRAAEALWRDDLGTVQPGKRADILLLRADPLADLAALRDIQHVIQDGHVLDPADLFAEARGNTG